MSEGPKENIDLFHMLAFLSLSSNVATFALPSVPSVINKRHDLAVEKVG